MTIEDRISVVEHLSNEYIAITKKIAAVVKTQNEIYDTTVENLAPGCRFETELRSAVGRVLRSDEEYLRLQDDWQRLIDRKDNITKELEAHRWRVLAECVAQAGGMPVDLLISGVQGASH